MVRLASLLLLSGGFLKAGFATPEARPSHTGLLQMITYIKRNPNMTQEEFWQYWDTQHAPKVIPLATHVGISRYQQIRVAGKIVPTNAGATEPVSNDLVDFDGIAMFLYQSAGDLTDMLSHPYYIEIVEPDEHILIDKSAHGGGMVATYIGKHIEVVDNSQNVWKGDRKTLAKYERLFRTY
ncbi:hypothetical protein FAVG1_09181 [Fusarium avenaceum]|nr:hypothetical protein FAVG1_09181 [Fusarium avenaceum]